MEGVEEVEDGVGVEEGEGSDVLSFAMSVLFSPPPRFSPIVCMSLCSIIRPHQTMRLEVTNEIHFQLPTIIGILFKVISKEILTLINE